MQYQEWSRRDRRTRRGCRRSSEPCESLQGGKQHEHRARVKSRNATTAEQHVQNCVENTIETNQFRTAATISSKTNSANMTVLCFDSPEPGKVDRDSTNARWLYCCSSVVRVAIASVKPDMGQRGRTGANGGQRGMRSSLRRTNEESCGEESKRDMNTREHHSQPSAPQDLPNRL
jgi:hypothetical protein